jgi:RHS repeat-associated protein
MNGAPGYSYDAAGNVLTDGLSSGCSGNGYTWNAEELASCTNGTTYTYNGDGERVKKSSGTLYWGGQSGGALAESDLSGNLTSEYIFFNGRRIARRDLGPLTVYYYFSDHLGSSSVITDAAGSIKNESDYYPFGGESSIASTVPNHNKFTGKERDSESGNDHFGARYFASSMARWLSPDPSGLSFANPSDPQSLNLYAYVGNHPMIYVDPYGMNWFTASRCNGQAIDNLTVGNMIRTFISNLFTSCGGGGGGDGGGYPDTGWPVTKRPFRQPLTQLDVSERLNYVKQNLSKPCKKAYSGVGKRLGIPFSMGTFARSLENGELDQHPNEEPGKYSGADATTDPSGSNGPNQSATIHTWANFYGLSFQTQGYALWHELTHKVFGIGDDESNAPGPGRDFNTQFAPYHYGGDYGEGGTAQFTDWLEGGCPAQ